MENQWISVKDRLPEIGVSVIACCDLQPSNGSYQGRYSARGFHPSGLANIHKPYLHMTHWMPLPEPPTK